MPTIRSGTNAIFSGMFSPPLVALRTSPKGRSISVQRRRVSLPGIPCSSTAGFLLGFKGLGGTRVQEFLQRHPELLEYDLSRPLGPAAHIRDKDTAKQ